ncbi:hypothetical protein Naga_101914g1 [Nannochloropsis gaditana]|uniref:Uncharacterized protein n=1 Tax=Nannochloropsis gaditana TaxID=72520 RepID=W7T020_9STRA|nr:hypothetical protein Naga_101914g1 [Nannochloropsis gaditana]
MTTTLALSSQALLLSSVVSDNYAYFGTANGDVIEVDLTDFSEVNHLYLDSGSVDTAIVNADYAYFGVVDDSKTTVVKVNLAGLTLSENVQLWGLTLRTSVVSGSYAYFGSNDDQGVVVKMNLDDLTSERKYFRYENFQFNDVPMSISTSFVSAGYVYFG